MDWLEKIHLPFFGGRDGAEAFITRELARAVPEGWAVERSSGDSLEWIVKKVDRPPAGEWHDQMTIRLRG
jgi:hypothetical protein